MLNLENYQVEWLCRHLGHTSDIHKAFYRNMSGLVERVQISKLLIMQDMNQSERFNGKSLEEIDIAGMFVYRIYLDKGRSKNLA